MSLSSEPTQPVATPAGSLTASENISLTELLERPGVLELLLAALAFILFCGTLAFQFVYDDRMQIVTNESIRHWGYVPRYFTGNVWQLFDSHILANYYRPLFLLWLKINYSLFGLAPAGWHASTLLWHIIATVQVFWLGRRLLGSRWLAGAAAALFAVHPIHVESVAWVSGVTDPMLAVFMLGSTLAYLRYREAVEARARRANYILALLFATLALLSKEVAVVLPVLLVATAIASPSQRAGARQLSLEAFPFFLLDAVYLLVRNAALHGFSHPLTVFSDRYMFLTWPSVLVFYARQLLAPFWLSPYANLHWVTSLGLKAFWLPLAVVLVLLTVAVWTWKRSTNRRRLTAVYAWLLLPLLPALYIKIFSVAEVVHDRYLYVSTIGYVLLVAMTAQWLSNRWPAQKKALQWVGAAILLVFAATAFSAEMDWASDLLLFQHAVEIAPENDAAVLNLGIMYIEHGKTAEGGELLRSVCERNPGSAPASYNYAHFLFLANRNVEAEQYYRRALKVDPSQENWWIQLAGTQMKLGKLQDAETSARTAIARNPSVWGFHVVLGAILSASGNSSDAAAEFREALRLDPNDKAAAAGLLQLQPSAH